MSQRGRVATKGKKQITKARNHESNRRLLRGFVLSWSSLGILLSVGRLSV